MDREGQTRKKLSGGGRIIVKCFDCNPSSKVLNAPLRSPTSTGLVVRGWCGHLLETTSSTTCETFYSLPGTLLCEEWPNGMSRRNYNKFKFRIIPAQVPPLPSGTTLRKDYNTEPFNGKFPTRSLIENDECDLEHKTVTSL